MARWASTGLAAIRGGVIKLIRETNRPVMSRSGKVALLWSGLGFGGLSFCLIFLTVETDRKKVAQTSPAFLNSYESAGDSDAADAAMGYPKRWKGRKIVSINTEPPSGAEVTFLEVDPSGRVISPERIEFVGYDELHYLERSGMSDLNQ